MNDGESEHQRAGFLENSQVEGDTQLFANVHDQFVIQLEEEPAIDTEESSVEVHGRGDARTDTGWRVSMRLLTKLMIL
jgi:hypothetical protein